MNLLALDIGGANIKLADGQGYAASHPFALWKQPEQLATQLAHCLAEAPPHNRIVVTMTGELCDCFETKRAGVRHIVDATLKAAGGTPVLFYQTTGEFVSADEACEKYLLTAASNWHALATFAATFCDDKPGMLVDIGSTTTDIIPILHTQEAGHGRTDPDRLKSGELVYTGIERSPVCAVVSHLQWHDSACPVAQELFATTGDAYLLLKELAEDSENLSTADGQPFDFDSAHARLARMVCGDCELVSRAEVISFAEEIQEAQLKLLEPAFSQVIGVMGQSPEVIVLSGHGEFLARRLLKRLEFDVSVISLTKILGPEVSRCATAHALAVIASETK